MSHLLTSDKEPTRASQNTEERNARKVRKRPTDEDYAQLKQIIVDADNNKIYERESLLGRGGFSRVYEVRDNNEDILWADKVVSLEMLKRSKNAYQKVQNEISLHRDLSHENIVRLVNDFQDEHYIHIILEHCSMGTLNDVLRERKIISETEARYYINQVLRGVQFIHDEGFLHCDIKLANIMLSRDMVVKIGDFGLACRIGECQPSGLKGTPNYVAPELLDLQPNSEASDVWACGILLYSLICGRPPFESKTLDETYEKIKTGDYLKPVDSSLKAVEIIDSMLTENVMQRGHLDVEKSLDGYLLTHPFFTESFMPKKLPNCAAFTDGWKLDFFDGAMPSGSPPPDKPYRMFSIPPSSPVDFADREDAMMTEVVNEAELIIVDQGPPLACSLQEPQGTILPQKETTKRFLDRVIQVLQKCQSICSNNGGSDVKIIPIFVKRWVSTNYGFVFELSDNSTGALFEDRSRIAVKGESVEAIDCMNKKNYYPIREAITDPGTLAQVKFLEEDGMSDTMKTNIPDNTSYLDLRPYKVVHTNGQNKNIQMKRWNWNEAEGCAVMELSNHVVQFEVNQGTLRAIVWEVEKPGQMFLTVVDVENNDVSTYSFHSFFMMGCPGNLRPLMDHAFQEITQMLRKRASIINYVP